MLNTTFGGMNTIFSAIFFGVHQGANWALDPIRHDFFLGFHPFGCQNVQQGTSQPQYMDGDRYPPVSFDMAILMIFPAINLIEELQGDFPCGSVSKPCTPGEHQNSW